VYAHHPERRVPTSNPMTAVRRFGGPVADEFFLLCRPGNEKADAGRQAEAVYEALRDVLVSEDVGPDALVSETVYFRRIRDHVEVARSARSRVLGETGLRPATTVIGQPPLDDATDFAVAAVAVVPRSPGSSSTHEVRRAAACRCEACASGVHGRVVRLGHQASLWTGNVHGSGPSRVDEAYDMFRVAEALLADAGMGFGDVMRMWVHVRDIERDYDALNEARRRFFRDCGLERRPASTGVQGTPASDAHAFSLSVHAVRSDRPLDVAVMSTPSLNEAWSYGADFSRGLRVADANQVTLYVSGTASVDEAGQTAYVGDFAAQAERMLHNIASLLEQQGAGFEDVVSGVAYLKDAGDAPMLRAMCRARGFDGFPYALVQAPLCRSDLLCEAEAVAVLPLAATGA
jgi:enamine deaminase RidA (YjgF/YER057c/UK114 family)